MSVNKGWIEETAKEIIWEFEQLLFENDIKINNKNPEENKFENEDSCINIKDYKVLKDKVISQLSDLEDYVFYTATEVA